MGRRRAPKNEVGMAEIITERVAVTTTGSDASATGTGTTKSLHGFLLDVYLDFHASAPNTTDTTIAYAERGGNIVAVANSSTDALIAPRQKLVDLANAAIADSHDRFALNGALTVTLAGCNSLTPALTAYIRYLRP
jgi:hypothetical protein